MTTSGMHPVACCGGAGAGRSWRLWHPYLGVLEALGRETDLPLAREVLGGVAHRRHRGIHVGKEHVQLRLEGREFVALCHQLGLQHCRLLLQLRLGGKSTWAIDGVACQSHVWEGFRLGCTRSMVGEVVLVLSAARASPPPLRTFMNVTASPSSRTRSVLPIAMLSTNMPLRELWNGGRGCDHMRGRACARCSRSGVEQPDSLDVGVRIAASAQCTVEARDERRIDHHGSLWSSAGGLASDRESRRAVEKHIARLRILRFEDLHGAPRRGGLCAVVHKRRRKTTVGVGNHRTSAIGDRGGVWSRRIL